MTDEYLAHYEQLLQFFERTVGDADGPWELRQVVVDWAHAYDLPERRALVTGILRSTKAGPTHHWEDYDLPDDADGRLAAVAACSLVNDLTERGNVL